jgi:hypothetical protein
MRDKGQMGGDLICPDNKASRLLAFLSPFSLELRTMRIKGAFAGSCFVARQAEAQSFALALVGALKSRRNRSSPKAVG